MRAQCASAAHWSSCGCETGQDREDSGSRSHLCGAASPQAMESVLLTNCNKQSLNSPATSKDDDFTNHVPSTTSDSSQVDILKEYKVSIFLLAPETGSGRVMKSDIFICMAVGQLDEFKSFLIDRKAPEALQRKVISWFDYLWRQSRIPDEQKVFSHLPDSLKAEIAIHVHLDTLKRVDIFQDAEEGFLSELVLRLRPALYSPGDYICRKGQMLFLFTDLMTTISLNWSP
nr:unnamed protein product [Spirometra erinaceieuropaei]